MKRNTDEITSTMIVQVMGDRRYWSIEEIRTEVLRICPSNRVRRKITRYKWLVVLLRREGIVIKEEGRYRLNLSRLDYGVWMSLYNQQCEETSEKVLKSISP